MSDQWKPNYRPSNGTEGDIFRAHTCDLCIHDHDWHLSDDGGGMDSCPIIMDALAGEHSYPNPLGPPQWEVRWRDDGFYDTRCTNFEACECES